LQILSLLLGICDFVDKKTRIFSCDSANFVANLPLPPVDEGWGGFAVIFKKLTFSKKPKFHPADAHSPLSKPARRAKIFIFPLADASCLQKIMLAERKNLNFGVRVHVQSTLNLHPGGEN